MQGTRISYRIVSVESIREDFKKVPDLLSYEKLPEFLVGDEVRLKQVLINLTKNALKFTPYGTVNIYAAYDEVTQLLYI